MTVLTLSMLMQMPGPGTLSFIGPAPRNSLLCKSPGAGHTFRCKSPGVPVGGGGIVTSQIDTCIKCDFYVLALCMAAVKFSYIVDSMPKNVNLCLVKQEQRSCRWEKWCWTTMLCNLTPTDVSAVGRARMACKYFSHFWYCLLSLTPFLFVHPYYTILIAGVSIGH